MTPLIALNPTSGGTDTTLANGITGKFDSLVVIFKDITTRRFDTTGIVEIIAMTTTDSTYAPTGADEIKLTSATVDRFDPSGANDKNVSGE